MAFLKRTLLFICLFPGMVRAQKSGWDYIRGNDFTQAGVAFQAALVQNPRDEATLTGLLFLAETIRDHESYEKYANQLLNPGWQPEYVWLFQQLCSETPETALKRFPPGGNYRLPFVLQQADTLFHTRHFAESAALRATVLPDWNWAICGPFTDISGSGFAETSPVENEPYSPADSFENEAGVRFQWLRRSVRRPGAPVDFDQLPESHNLATFYANTFLSVPSDRLVALEVTRGEPIKIWLDDQILIERPRPTAGGEWDSETLFFDLPAGKHRLLVKVAEFPREPAAGRIRLEFNDLDNDGDQDETHEFDDTADYSGASWTPPTRFVLRFTDPATGQLYTDIRSDYTGSYIPATRSWLPGFKEQPYLQTLLANWQAHRADTWRLYLVAKAYAKYEAWEDGEAFFAGLLAQEPGSAFLRFLLAKFYDADDKSERAEALLSEMDTTRTPTFAEHYIRLLKINREQEEPRYQAALEDMLALSPTNWSVLNRYLTFLKEKGKQDSVKGLVQQFLAVHDSPKWKSRLFDYLKDDSYKPESYKAETDKDREKSFREAHKRLKTTFDLTDYAKVIRFYKQKEKVDDVLKAYDEVLAIAPYLSQYRKQKAAYLFEKERVDEALELVRQQIGEQPYDASLCELAGDIYIEKKEEAEALKWYRRAEKLKSGGNYDLDGKIERLENKPNFSGYFAPVKLEEVAKDRSWLTDYPDEEAVIPLFAQQLVYLPAERKFQSTTKCVIAIRNEAGAKRWTEADLSLLGNVTNARVMKKDGSITSPDMGWGGMAVFKNLQPGDVILLEGASERGMPDEFSGEMLELGFASWPAPVVKATLELLLPKDQPVYFAYNRLDEAHTQRDTGALSLRRWEWRHIPKMEEEEAMPDNIDAMAWFMLGDAPDWSGVAKWYQRKTYCRTEPNYEVLQQARALLQPGMSETEIVQALHTFITKDINYSYVPFLNSNYVPKKPGATLSAKVGDCKDVATLMITMLREQGIPAWYTLVSTHNFSNEEPRPTAFVFNHAIVAYQTSDGQLHFDDLTTDYFPCGVLPNSDSDAWGLVIRDGETKIRRLPNHALDPDITRVDIQAQATLDTLGNLHLDARVVRHGAAAGHWREVLLRATEAERYKKLTDYYGGGVLSHLDVEKTEFQNLDSTNAPLRSHTRLTAFHQMDQVAGLFILPLPLPLSTPTHKALFAAKRYNDLDADVLLELSPVRETVDLELPAGYRLAETPKPKVIDTPFGFYSLTFEEIPGGLRIRRDVTLRQRFIQHTDFQAFKQFYLDMLDADDSLLALVSPAVRRP